LPLIRRYLASDVATLGIVKFDERILRDRGLHRAAILVTAPPDEMDVPTNSLATVGEFGLSKSIFKWFAQFE